MEGRLVEGHPALVVGHWVSGVLLGLLGLLGRLEVLLGLGDWKGAPVVVVHQVVVVVVPQDEGEAVHLVVGVEHRLVVVVVQREGGLRAGGLRARDLRVEALRVQALSVAGH